MRALLFSGLVACSGPKFTPGPDTPSLQSAQATSGPDAAPSKVMTKEECETQGGRVNGSKGGGSQAHCNADETELAPVRLGIEGGWCCKSTAATKINLDWKPAGRCLPNFWGGNLPCVQITGADAADLQTFLLAFLSPTFLKQHPEWNKARELAAKTSTDGFIGHFTIEGWGHAGFTGDVVRLRAVEGHENEAELGYDLIIGRTKTGWTVLWKNRYRDRGPSID